jgi:hypothetical protein
LDKSISEFFKHLGQILPPYWRSGRFKTFGILFIFDGRSAGTPPKTAPHNPHLALFGFRRRYIIEF